MANMIRNLLKKIRIAYLEYRAAWLYRKYHRSFLDRINEAVELNRIPDATVIVKNDLNAVIRELHSLGAGKRWARELV